jgi:hypothetical protein
MYVLFIVRQSYRIIAFNLLILVSGQALPGTENGDGRFLGGLVAFRLPSTC